MQTRNFQYFLLIFIITLILAVLPFVMGGSHMVIAYTQPVLTLEGTDEDLITDFGPGDQASYAKGAKLLSQGQDARPYYFGLWAPGFTVLESIMIRWWPGPLVEGLAMVTAVLWALSLATVGLVLKALSRSALYPSVLFLAFFSSLLRHYFLIYGIILSESISICFFLAGSMLLCFGLSQKRVPFTILAAFLLMLATMFRAQFLLTLEMSFAMLVGGAVLCRVVPVLRRNLRDMLPLRSLLVVIALYALPITAYSVWNNGGFVHLESFYGYAWRPAPHPTDFVEAGGGGVLCQIDPKTCHRMQAMPAGTVTWQDNRRTIIHSILTHPFHLFVYKTHYFIEYFFLSPDGGHGYLENGLLALMSLGSLAGCLYLVRRVFFQALLLLQVGTWIGSLAASYTLIHFEARYLYIGKSLAFVAFLAVGAALFQEYRTRRSISGQVSAE